MTEADDAPIQYWDSQMYISFLTKKPSTRVEVVRQLMRDASWKPPKVRPVGSQLIRAEVINHPNDDPAHTQIIDEFFLAARSIVRFYDLNRQIASVSRDLMATYRIDGLTVPDSIHLATAIVAGADVFFTYDGYKDNERRRSGGLLQFDGEIGAPNMRISEPVVDWGPVFATLGKSDSDLS
jgi:predicted nucleic acid-binding protein